MRPLSGSPLSDLLDAAGRADAARPLLTFYDDATGERVELSVASTANWAAKTASLLADGFGAEPGERVAVRLPLHWRTAVVLLGCWQAGLTVTDDPADVPVAFAAPDDLDWTAGVAEVCAVSLAAFGTPPADPPAGTTDYAAEVAGYADRFPARSLAGPALVLGGQPVGADALLAAARDGRVPPGARVLTTLPFDTVDGVLAGLVGPLAVGGSVVLCRHSDPARLADRVGIERVTVTVGPPPG